MCFNCSYFHFFIFLDDIANECSEEFLDLKEKSEKAEKNVASTVVNSVAASLKERFSGKTFHDFNIVCSK